MDQTNRANLEPAPLQLVAAPLQHGNGDDVIVVEPPAPPAPKVIDLLSDDEPLDLARTLEAIMDDEDPKLKALLNEAKPDPTEAPGVAKVGDMCVDKLRTLTEPPKIEIKPKAWADLNKEIKKGGKKITKKKKGSKVNLQAAA